MDGAPIDSVRQTYLPFLNDRDRELVEKTLADRAELRIGDHSIGDVTIRLLPLVRVVKDALIRNGIDKVSEIPEDATWYRGIRNAGQAEIRFVLACISEPDGQISRKWLGLP